MTKARILVAFLALSVLSGCGTSMPATQASSGGA
jgi:uncharacterized protein YceK